MRFIKEQEANGLLSNLGLKTPLCEIPLLGDTLFQIYKINELVNNFLLAGDEFMPETHLRQPGFTVLVLKIKKEYKNIKKQDIHNIFIKRN